MPYKGKVSVTEHNTYKQAKSGTATKKIMGPAYGGGRKNGGGKNAIVGKNG